MDARLRRIAPLAGVLFVVIYAAHAALGMKDAPAFAADGSSILAFFNENADRVLLGAMLDLSATPLWFLYLGILRSAMGVAEGGTQRMSTIAFGAGISGGTLGTAGAALTAVAAMRARNGTLTESTATVYFDANNMLAYTALGASLAAFALATGIFALRHKALLPKWLAIVTIVTGIALLIPPISWVAAQFGLLIILWSSLELYRQRAGEL